MSDSERACLRECLRVRTSMCVRAGERADAHSVTEARACVSVSVLVHAVLDTAYACVRAFVHAIVRARACMNVACVRAVRARARGCACAHAFTRTHACASIRRGAGGHARTIIQINHTCRLTRTLKRKHTCARAHERMRTRTNTQARTHMQLFT